MKSVKALALAVSVVCAVPCFAAFQAHISIKGTKQGQFKGEGVNLTSFSWGVTHAPVAGVPGCASQQIHFALPAGDEANFLTQACQRNERLNAIDLDLGPAEHHLLQGAVVTSCSNNMFTIHFDHCATHAQGLVRASIVDPMINIRPNGRLVFDNLAQDLDVANIHPGGANGLIIVVRNASPELMQRCATGKHFKEVSLTCRKAGKGQQKFYEVKLTEVFVSSYQQMGDGSAQLSLNFAKSDAPIAMQDFH